MAEATPRARLLAALGGLRGGWIDSDVLIVVHHEPLAEPAPPGGALEQTDARVYGRSQLTFLQWRAESPGE
jgi:hypothetical protein